MNNLHIFLGATVADAATRPLHWVYDPKKLKKYIKGKKEIAFLKKNRSPFYNIKTGKVSGYNDIGQVMFKTLITSKISLSRPITGSKRPSIASTVILSVYSSKVGILFGIL